MKPSFGQNVLHNLLRLPMDFYVLMEQYLFKRLYIKMFTVIIDDLKVFIFYEIPLKAYIVFMAALTYVVLKMAD